ncbi:MAG: DUF4350 domain-containing protein [Desulfuromonadales bacterium]|nr:DUF4350 domain-containing protein [Desulfuromonadales bacterium]
MSYSFRSLHAILLFGTLLFALTTPVSAAQPQILFDQGHGQMFTIAGKGDLDLSTFARLFDEAGRGVPHAQSAPLDAAALSTARALVISGPFSPYSDAEVETLFKFVEKGGRLAIMLHIGPPAARLLERLGVNVANGVVREDEALLDGNPLNFSVAQLGTHPLFSAIEWFDLYGAWALLPVGDNTRAEAETGPQAWVDLNRSGQFDDQDVRQSFAVVVSGRIGAGEFLVFGDDAIFQNRYLTGNNLQLARNLVDWLTK